MLLSPKVGKPPKPPSGSMGAEPAILKRNRRAHDHVHHNPLPPSTGESGTASTRPPPRAASRSRLASPTGLFPYLLRRVSQPSWEREEERREHKSPKDSCSLICPWIERLRSLRGPQAGLPYQLCPSPRAATGNWQAYGTSGGHSTGPKSRTSARSFVLPLVPSKPTPYSR